MIELFQELLWEEIFIIALLSTIILIYFNNK